MNKYLTLTKTFMHALSMPPAVSKAQKRVRIAFTLFIIFGLFIPVTGAVFFVSMYMAYGLGQVGIAHISLSMMLHIICLFSIVFGMLVVLSSFYFSTDIEYILPWPMHASTVVGARFTAVYIGENMIEILFLLATLAGYALTVHVDTYVWVMGLVGLVFLPVLPIVYCAVISMFIMAFSSIVRSKDNVQRLTVGLLITALVVIVLMIGRFQSFDFQTFVDSLASGKHTVVDIANYVFPNVALFVRFISSGNVLWFMLYILVSVLAVLVMLWLSELLYLKGILNVRDTGTNKPDTDIKSALKRSSVKSPYFTLALKELRILFRTPTYFSNCIVPNFIWPVLAYAIYTISGTRATFSAFKAAYISGDSNTRMVVLIFVIALSIVVAGLNSISSSAISRDGKYLGFMKYIPVDYDTQLRAKAFVGIILPAVGVLVFFIPFMAAAGAGIIKLFVYSLISVLSIITTSFVSIYIDSLNPKLVWDDELSSLRENYNTIFSMAAAIVISGALCAFVYFFFGRLPESAVEGIIVMALSVSTLVSYTFSLKHSAKNLEIQE